MKEVLVRMECKHGSYKVVTVREKKSRNLLKTVDIAAAAALDVEVANMLWRLGHVL